MPLKILVAEDNPKILNAYVNVLTKRGHKVTTAPDGEVAIGKYRNELNLKNLKDHFPFDLVIVDQAMPKKDGATLVGEILDLRPNQRILFATAHEDQMIKNFDQIRRGVEVLNKPFSLQALIKNVETKVIPKIKAKVRTGQFRKWDSSELSSSAGPGPSKSGQAPEQFDKIR